MSSFHDLSENIDDRPEQSLPTVRYCEPAVIAAHQKVEWVLESRLELMMKLRSRESQ
jgi:hypothetical protein